MTVRGSSVLITHTLISNIMGSTMVCAQVAEELQRMGASVVVLASSFTGSARAIFENKGIRVEVGEDLEASIFDFDYVWVHSQLLPLSFVEQLGTVSREHVPDGKRLPAFIFNHMSALDASPDEHPYIPLLEETIASAEVFVSQEARDALNKDYDTEANQGIPQRIVPNPAPSIYAQSSKVGTHPRVPQRIAIISNHVPPELFDAAEMLGSADVHVDIIGEQGVVQEVTPALIAQYDGVITIGKTVQYCMMSSTPVFVYDRFGGFGYLNDENFDACAYANFSGRGGARKNGEGIAKDVIDDFQQACSYSDAMHGVWRETYGMEHVLEDLFESVEPRTSITFPYPGYEHTLRMQMRFAWRYYRSWDFELWMRAQKQHLEDELHRVKEVVAERDKAIDSLQAEMQALHGDLGNVREELAKSAEQLQQVYDSHSYRIGNALMAPLSIIKKRRR